MKNKYKKPKGYQQHMFGSLINQGVTGLSKALGAKDSTAEIIGSSVATATGIIPGMQANLTQAGDLVGDIGTAAGDKSGVTNAIGQMGSMAMPLMMSMGGDLTMNDYAKRARAMRKGARDNKDGTESTHLMAWGESDSNYVAYPTLFQKEDGSWYESENPFEEAKKRKEIFEFQNKQQAQDFAYGAWKEQESLPRKRINQMANGGQLTEYNAGGTHEQNLNGGIPIGQGASVEQGETRDKDYIFSDRLKINKQLQQEFNLPKKAIGKTFAEVSKMFNDSDYTQDAISKRGYEKEINNLRQAQEAFKAVEMPEQQVQPQQQMMAAGGPLGMMNWDDVLTQGLNQDFINKQNATLPVKTNNSNSSLGVTDWGSVLHQMKLQDNSNQAMADARNYKYSLDDTELNNTSLPNQTQQDLSGMPDFEKRSQMPYGPPNPNVNNPNIPNPESGKGLSTTDLRYAPLLSGAANLAMDFANKPQPKDLGMFNVNTQIDPNYINMSQIKRDINSNANATRDSIIESSPSQGAMMSNLLGSQLQSDRAIGNAELQQQGMNNQEDARIDQFNFNKDRINQANRMQVSQFNDADLAAYQDNIRTGISEMGQNVGNVGLDEMFRNMVKGMNMDYFTTRTGNTTFKN